jgi:hypothetical protein
MMPFGGSGGFNVSSISQRSRSVSGNELPSETQYTGQLYASRDPTNGLPLIQRSKGGTYYMTSGRNRRYV